MGEEMATLLERVEDNKKVKGCERSSDARTLAKNPAYRWANVMSKFKRSIGYALLGLGLFGYISFALQQKPTTFDRTVPSAVFQLSKESANFMTRSPEVLLARLGTLKAKEIFFGRRSMFFLPIVERPYLNISEASDLSIELFDYISENMERLSVCNGRRNFYTSRRYPRIYKVAEQRYIVELVCIVGAYQRRFQYFLYNGRAETIEAIPLAFDRFQKKRKEDGSRSWKPYRSEYVTGARVYDAERQILNFFAKDIGLASCGAFSRYQWDDGASRFQLLEYRVREDCHPGVRPEQYPLVYQAS